MNIINDTYLLSLQKDNKKTTKLSRNINNTKYNIKNIKKHEGSDHLALLDPPVHPKQ